MVDDVDVPLPAGTKFPTKDDGTRQLPLRARSIFYGTPAALTITLASLATDASLIAGRQSTIIDNTVVRAPDYLIGGKIMTGGTPSASKQIELWVFGSYDGTTYGAGAGAADANFSPTGEKTLMRLLQVIPTDATASHSYEFGPFSLARAFDGVCPPKFGAFVVHNTGAALDATGGNHEIKVTPIWN